MSDLLAIGASGVQAYQTALATVSDNIANVATDGYVRRSANLSEIHSSTGLTSLSARAGNGVAVTGVMRASDALKTAAVRDTGADLAKTASAATWLTDVQSALTGNSLGDRITGFYNSATALAADPSSIGARATMLEAASSAAGAFTATGHSLDQAASDLDTNATLGTGKLDLLGASLAKINEGLGRTQTGSTTAAQLADQRDAVLEQMSALSDVSVSTDSLGRASVRLGGNSGPVFVHNSDSGQVTYSRNGGTVAFAVHMLGETATLTPNGGALAGVVDGAQKVQEASDTLDALATSFITAANAFQAGGTDLDGNAGMAMFATGRSATDISVAITDPRKIAAASVGGGVRDGSNLNALQTARTSIGVEAKLTSLISGNATAIEQRTTVATAQTAIHDGAVAARQSQSGVALNTEAIDLMRFQQAYSASSRIIQVARETFQSILQIG